MLSVVMLRVADKTFMLSVTNKPLMLSAVMLSVIMLIVIMLIVFMLIVIMLIVFMLNVFRLIVFMLIVFMLIVFMLSVTMLSAMSPLSASNKKVLITLTPDSNCCQYVSNR
jgi:hypothetical protein